jgi:hypothetical protein
MSPRGPLGGPRGDRCARCKCPGSWCIWVGIGDGGLVGWASGFLAEAVGVHEVGRWRRLHERGTSAAAIDVQIVNRAGAMSHDRVDMQIPLGMPTSADLRGHGTRRGMSAAAKCY